MTAQLPLDLRFAPGRARGDYVVSGANAPALAALDAWPGWAAGRAVLAGAEGTGKTHLAHVWAEETGAPVLTARWLDAPPDGALAIEDADRIAGNARAETALFHALNAAAAAGAPVLLTARTPPAEWALGLPDLASRLGAAHLITLPPPDDALLAALLTKLFADRGIQPAPALIPWLVQRIERSAAAAQAAVAALDAAALAEGAPVGPGIARRVLAA